MFQDFCDAFLKKNTITKTLVSTVFFVLMMSSLFGQDTAWEKIQLDENVTILYPEVHERMDTLFQEVLLAYEGDTTFLVNIFKAKKYKHTNKKLLKEGYDQYLKGIMDVLPEGRIVSQGVQKIDGLLAKILEIEFQLEGEKLLQQSCVVFIREKTYSFQIMFRISDQNPINQNSFKRYIKGIKFGGLKVKDQI